ncbi:sugar transferase [Weissella confusa]|uniref:sugar transferase n=1 Tax=Weissella confusa TaxID=1583 RepID=UPI001553A33F|nr:sugar transferase [Weissella confusa]
MIYKNYVKRLLDIVFSTFGLVITLIPMLVIGIVIKMTSEGTVFFRQQRFGKNSEPFTMFKFRTMATGSPIVANQDFGDMSEYVTSVGAFLRKTSLDELPQLWNVLRGEMSFVGPRPLADTDMEVIELRRANGGDCVRPGITGLAQVNGRNKLTNAVKAEFDSKYAMNLNFILEFKIVLMTLLAVVSREGINHNDGESL